PRRHSERAPRNPGDRARRAPRRTLRARHRGRPADHARPRQSPPRTHRPPRERPHRMTDPATATRTDHTPSKRMTLSQVVEALLNRGGGERSSVALSRNAKGETQIGATVRTADTGAVETIE